MGDITIDLSLIHDANINYRDNRNLLRNSGLILLEDLPRIPNFMKTSLVRMTLAPSSYISKTNANTNSLGQQKFLQEEFSSKSILRCSYIYRIFLLFWVFYLILSRNLRKHLLRAYSRNYKKIEEHLSSLEKWINPHRELKLNESLPLSITNCSVEDGISIKQNGRLKQATEILLMEDPNLYKDLYSNSSYNNFEPYEEKGNALYPA